LLLLCPESSFLTAFMPKICISDCYHAENATKSFILCGPRDGQFLAHCFLLAKCWPSFGQFLTNFWSSFGQVLARCWPSGGQVWANPEVLKDFSCVLQLLCLEYSILTAFMPRSLISDYLMYKKPQKASICLNFWKKDFFSLF
jgi:hypothetical protein